MNWVPGFVVLVVVTQAICLLRWWKGISLDGDDSKRRIGDLIKYGETDE